MSKPVVHFTSLLDRAALEHLKSKTLLPSFSHYDVWLYEHAVGFTVAKMMNADLLQTTQSALVQAMESGQAYDKFVKNLKPYLMAQGWWGESVMTDPVDGVAKTVQLGSTRRLRMIFQTNLATAYAAGQWARVQEDKADFPYLKYIASTAEQKRASHMTYYGKIWRVDDPIWQSIFPPNGYGCQCTVRQLNEKQALRERGEDINSQPEKFTERQKANHAKGIIDDGTGDIQWADFTNPRTGQTVKIPFDIAPTFAHNHGDRLGALLKLIQDKHGTEKGALFEKMLDDYLLNRMAKVATVADFSGIVVLQKEVARLLYDSDTDQNKLWEAVPAAQWQVYFNVRLERYDLDVKNPPDFLILEEGVAREQLKTLDFMYTMSGRDEYAINSFNQNFMSRPKRIRDEHKTIGLHLQKADILPMDLRHLNTQNRIKLLSYVLSLPQEYQKKIVFIVGKTS